MYVLIRNSGVLNDCKGISLTYLAYLSGRSFEEVRDYVSLSASTGTLTYAKSMVSPVVNYTNYDQSWAITIIVVDKY